MGNLPARREICSPVGLAASRWIRSYYGDCVYEIRRPTLPCSFNVMVAFIETIKVERRKPSVTDHPSGAAAAVGLSVGGKKRIKWPAKKHTDGSIHLCSLLGLSKQISPKTCGKISSNHCSRTMEELGKAVARPPSCSRVSFVATIVLHAFIWFLRACHLQIAPNVSSEGVFGWPEIYYSVGNLRPLSATHWYVQRMHSNSGLNGVRYERSIIHNSESLRVIILIPLIFGERTP